MAAKLIDRRQKSEILIELGIHPAVVLLGPRQAGKTTLAKAIAREMDGVYIDCSNLKTQEILREQRVASYADRHAGRLIVIDEIQSQEGLFNDLRGIIDERRRQGFGTGCFLLIGSAGIKLANKSTETLYGRLATVGLHPLDVLEIRSDDDREVGKLWLRGGLPASFTAGSDADSSKVREQVLDVLVGAEAARAGIRIDKAKIHKLCVFLAHSQGQQLNFSSTATQLDMDRRAVRRIIELLDGLLVARTLPPLYRNSGKRLAKTPRFYYRDSGLLHQLLEIETAYTLDRHPIQGPSWEGFVIENIIRQMDSDWLVSYYRTQDGAEIDLVLESPSVGLWAIEISKSALPALGKGFHIARRDLQPDRVFVVHRNSHSCKSKEGIEFLTLPEMCREVAAAFAPPSEDE